MGNVSALDPDIPEGVENIFWIETPGIWWKVVKKFSRTMLAKQKSRCQFRSVCTPIGKKRLKIQISQNVIFFTISLFP